MTGDDFVIVPFLGIIDSLQEGTRGENMGKKEGFFWSQNTVRGLSFPVKSRIDRRDERSDEDEEGMIKRGGKNEM